LAYSIYLFDFDYTLADSERAIVACYRHVLEKHGYTGASDYDICKTIGYPVKNSMTMLTGETDIAKLEQYHLEFRQKADEVMVNNTDLYPSTVPTLEKLRSKGCRIGIISTKYRFRIEDILKRFNITNLVDIIIGGEDIALPKPDPQGIFLALERLGGQKSDVLYIGDSLVDANAANNAAVDFAAVTTGTTQAREFEALPHIKIMNDLSEL
jgi:phosphoglycolate phosphatase